MYHISSLRTFLRTTLVCSLLAVGLLVVGCDSGGSNGGGSNGGGSDGGGSEDSGPAWTGNWKQTGPDGGDIFAISFSTSTIRDIEGLTCDVSEFEVTDISDDNVVTSKNVEEGNTVKQKLEVTDNGKLRSIFPGSGDVRTTYEPADDSKSIEEIVGC